jgi:hypothetical protein
MDVETRLAWDVFNCFHRPDGQTAAFCERQHFWELGRRGFRVPDMRQRLSAHFDILSAYRNFDWLPSYNFVLRSRATQG